MRRALALIVTLGLVLVLSGAALADGLGMCEYRSQTQKTMAKKTDALKTVTTKALPQAEVDKLLLAQTNNDVKAAPSKKK